MVYKIRKTKGRHPQEPKTDQREIPTDIRHSMVMQHEDGKSDHQIGLLYDKHHYIVGRVIERAKEKAERHSRPLLDISNIYNSPRRRHRPRVFTDNQEREIHNKATKNQPTRAKSALAYISEMELEYSESMFQKIMYKFRQHHLPSAEKPKLNRRVLLVTGHT
jgi:hypothetical protein